jgi:hypothetical protein
VHRRGGYRDPESQAFIESWFSKLKQRCIWREEFEALDEAREKIGRYVDRPCEPSVLPRCRTCSRCHGKERRLSIGMVDRLSLGESYVRVPVPARLPGTYRGLPNSNPEVHDGTV